MSWTARPAARRTGSVLLAAVLAAGLGTGLTACSPKEAGSAAVVGDRTVSTADLDAALQAIRSGNEQFAQVPASAVLVDLVAGPMLLEAAREAGIPVSADSARTLLTRSQDPDERAVHVLQAQIALEQLREDDPEAVQAIGEELRKQGLKISPRYGELNLVTLEMDDSQRPDWIAETPQSEESGTPGVPGQPGEGQSEPQG